MIIRSAKESDFEEIHNLMYQIFELHFLRRPDIYKEGYSYTLKEFTDTLKNEDEMMLTAEVDGKVAGVCHMVKKSFDENSFIRKRCIAYIEDFCVDKAYKRHGIGRSLFNESLEASKSWGADSLELNVWEVNNEARKFYDSVGLKPKSTRMELTLK